MIPKIAFGVKVEGLPLDELVKTMKGEQVKALRAGHKDAKKKLEEENGEEFQYPTLSEIIWRNIDESGWDQLLLETFKFLGKSFLPGYKMIFKDIKYDGKLDIEYLKTKIKVGAVTGNINVEEGYYKNTDIRLSDLVRVLEYGMVSRNIKASFLLKKSVKEFEYNKKKNSV